MKCSFIPEATGATGIVTAAAKVSGNSIRQALMGHTGDTIDSKDSATIRNLKPEWWGAPRAQEDNYGEKNLRLEVIIMTTTTKKLTSRS
jgi:hypothetical protein